MIWNQLILGLNLILLIINTEDNLEQLNILSNDENYDSSIRAIQNSRLIVIISECDIFFSW